MVDWIASDLVFLRKRLYIKESVFQTARLVVGPLIFKIKRAGGEHET